MISHLKIMLNLKFYQVLLFFLLLFITFATFSPIINAKYSTIDDFVMIRNPNRKALKDISFKHIEEIFKSSHEGLYHPLVTISYSIERTVFGFVPEIFHFDNLLLHIFNVSLVFIIFLIISKSFWISFIVTALFAIHPTRAEVVDWISARKDTLYSFFYLLSLLCYIKAYTSNKKNILILLSALCFLLSCFSKAMAITLPFLLILIDCYTHNFSKHKLKIYFIYIFIALFFIVAAVRIHYFGTRSIVVSFSFFQLFVNFINAHFNILFYLDKFILPVKLYCMYPFFYNRFTMPPNFILYSPLFLYIIFLLCILSLKETKTILFGFMFFLITLLPTMGLLKIGDFAVADRYTYIPYLGLFFIAAKTIIFLYNKSKKYLKITLLLLCFIIFVTFNILSYKRTIEWKNNTYGPPKKMKYYKFGIVTYDKQFVLEPVSKQDKTEEDI